MKPRYRGSTRKPLMCLFLAHAMATPGAAQDVQRQIEEEVWIPLLRASAAFDADAFLALQSTDLVRVAIDAKQVYGLDRYQREIREGFARARARGITRTSEVRFLERTATDSLAYETGYFRSRVTLPGGEERVRYTRFEMVLRKEGGKWKILIDKDTAEGGRITEEMFRAAEPVKAGGSEGGNKRGSLHRGLPLLSNPILSTS